MHASGSKSFRLFSLAGTALPSMALLALLAPQSAQAQCGTCPPGGIQENEPQCTVPDVVNGGCNSAPPIFGAINFGQTICGSGWFDGGTRDTDWFQINLAADTLCSLSGTANFDSLAGFIDGRAGCPVTNVTFYALTTACQPIVVEQVLPAGTWWVFIAPQFTNIVPCGTTYSISLATGTTGSCCLPSGGCQVMTATACGVAGGVYRGDNTPCGGCPLPPNTWVEVGEAGDTIATAQMTQGNGSLNRISGNISAGTDADMYAFNLCSPANFSAETVTGPGTLGDTQLFLFKPSGLGVSFNDDDPQGTGGLRSRLGNAFAGALPAGLYYIAVTGFDHDPVTAAAAELWADTPYNVERAPDGPGAASPISSWNGTTSTGTYTITMTGACFGAPGAVACYANCDGSTTNPVLTVADFGCFLNAFAAGQSYANCDHSTTNPVLTVADFGCFLNAFAAGCS